MIKAPLCAVAILAAVTPIWLGAPATAQMPPGAYVSQGEFDAAQEAARRRQVDLENRLNAQDAARRADEAVASLRAQAAVGQGGATPVPGLRLSQDPGPYAVIPDDRLAASNARVREAAANRR